MCRCRTSWLGWTRGVVGLLRPPSKNAGNPPPPLSCSRFPFYRSLAWGRGWDENGRFRYDRSFLSVLRIRRMEGERDHRCVPHKRAPTTARDDRWTKQSVWHTVTTCNLSNVKPFGNSLKGKEKKRKERTRGARSNRQWNRTAERTKPLGIGTDPFSIHTSSTDIAR